MYQPNGLSSKWLSVTVRPSMPPFPVTQRPAGLVLTTPPPLPEKDTPSRTRSSMAVSTNMPRLYPVAAIPRTVTSSAATVMP